MQERFRYNFRITKIVIGKNCRKDICKTLELGEYVFTKSQSGFANNYFGENLSVCAIVGKNGSGKSSLLELMYRIINNVCYKYFDNKAKKKEHVFVEGIEAELHYVIKDIPHIIKCTDNDVEIITGPKRLSPASTLIVSKHLFYTIGLNYAPYAFNVFDYEDETEDKSNWMEGMFHKKDGYASPIVLAPTRKEGKFNIQEECDLTRQRLVSVLWESKSRRKCFIEGYEMHDVYYTLNFSKIIRKNDLAEFGFDSTDQDKILSAFRRQLNRRNSFPSIILREFEIYPKLNTTRNYTLTCLYIVRKAITIIKNYPQFSKYERIANYGLLIMPHSSIPVLARLTYADFENLSSLYAAELKKHNSHINLKIRQAINYLDFLEDCDLEEQDILCLSQFVKSNDKTSRKHAVEYDGFNDLAGTHSIKRLSIEKKMELLPPAFFDIDIRLSKVKGSGAQLEPVVSNEIIPFHSLSSGEKQFLFVTSSVIYHLLNLKSVPTSRVHYRNFNIVLDEVEICFHPEYQRRYVNDFIEVLTRLGLTSFCSINIIISTHSPFILSDIPHGNIIYLKEGKPVMGVKNVLAANVNDILRDSFFLENGFMGEYVKKKVCSLIDYLVDNSSRDRWSPKSAEEFIEQIGEPFLKERLKDLLLDKRQ